MVVIMGGGSSIVLVTASMSSIPIALYEAAAIDGGGRWQMFWRITVPLLRPIMLYLIVMGTISSFQVFENIYLMTKGGPQFSTMTLVYLIYDTAFTTFDFGRASAQAIVLFAIIFGFGLLQFKLMASRVEY
jgi:multiple sugar transport system permease protein